MLANELKQRLDKDEKNREFLFIRGFLVTNCPEEINTEKFPFYGTWKKREIEGFNFYTHPKTGIYSEPLPSGGSLYLLGHAYNPFTMEYDEQNILKYIAENFESRDFFDLTDELTGIFVLGYIKNGELKIIADPAGIQSACHGVLNGFYYMSSHSQLAADVLGLKQDGFVNRLVEYKWYPRVMGAYLPADLTAFSELKRIVPNIEYLVKDNKITHKRFYPIKELSECKTDEEYQKVIEDAADILKNNMELISEKWKNPMISMTGGIDSNTTFAAANGIYDRFKTFSYFSAEKERIDCDAAKKISSAFGVEWKLFEIPDTKEKLTDYEIKTAIIKHNNAYIAKEKENELRKRLFLQKNLDADVEVKSWVSETIRGYWYKHYGRKKMPKLSAKLYRNLYKMFILNRSLAREVDKIFEKYIEDFEYRKIPSQYPPADVHFNEVTWGSWGSLNISEMKFYTDITIAYNNRRFLDLLFKVPLEKRISDEHHLDMKKYLNKKLYDMNIRVVNMHETDFRAFCLNVIFTINQILPF